MKTFIITSVFLIASAANADPVFCGKVLQESDRVSGTETEVSIVLTDVTKGTYAGVDTVLNPHRGNLNLKLKALHWVDGTQLSLIGASAYNASLLRTYVCISWSASMSERNRIAFHFGSSRELDDALADLVQNQ